jgi:hypothetical protein
MATRQTDDMRRGTSPVHMNEASVSNTPRGAGDTVRNHVQEGPFGEPRAGNRSGNLGARSGTLDTTRPQHAR